MKTSELTGTALDWAVLTIEQHEDAAWYIDHKGRLMEEHGELSWAYQPSTNWAQGGPIIEREGMDLSKSGRVWWALNDTKPYSGETLLIAAMRCYVASKMGDEIEIPEELT